MKTGLKAKRQQSKLSHLKKPSTLPILQSAIPQRTLSSFKFSQSPIIGKSNQTVALESKRVLKSPSVQEIGIDNFPGEFQSNRSSFGIVFGRRNSFYFGSFKKFGKIEQEAYLSTKIKSRLRDYQKKS